MTAMERVPAARATLSALRKSTSARRTPRMVSAWPKMKAKAMESTTVPASCWIGDAPMTTATKAEAQGRIGLRFYSELKAISTR
ncbi:hypothetical protein FHR75_004046 [Kineococcus radiotolerans]|uniref:Uncharacterized protein n=1 Tax=Kineococcus radiotolerans TaxID=131568 RepID=A0A7W4TQJ6_KINRA|nr:hypothetical protein [Kineococcus radiotolerans]MBB2903204.1 hypothetical protein [Kineococcus radiotolerans]